MDKKEKTKQEHVNKGVLEEKKVKEAEEEKRKQDAEKLLNAINKVFSTEEGMLVLKYFAVGTSAFNITADYRSNELTFFCEGRKKVFLDLWKLLNTNIKRQLIEELYQEKK